ncbi:hypothetical protein [Microbacterium rhizophilus]|uniref:hypothetical protein n=1 Tax=Microbacterium rhizophilus TaxID=3138934 RepID=UPI0031F0A809
MTWMDWALVTVGVIVLVGAVAWVMMRDRRARSLPGDEIPPVEVVRTTYEANVAKARVNQTYGPGATGVGGAC